MQKQGAPAVFDVPAPQYPIESVDKALKILLLLGERSELRLTDVAEYLNVATSTAHRLLAMLQYRGFVRQDPRTRAYRAGTALTGVALSILERFDVYRRFSRQFVPDPLTWNSRKRRTSLSWSAPAFGSSTPSRARRRRGLPLGWAIPCPPTARRLARRCWLTVPRTSSGGSIPTRNSARLAPTNSESTCRSALAAGAGDPTPDSATSNEESENGICSVAVAYPPRQAPMRLALNVAAPIHRMNWRLVRAAGRRSRQYVAESAKPAGPDWGDQEFQQFGLIDVHLFCCAHFAWRKEVLLCTDLRLRKVGKWSRHHRPVSVRRPSRWRFPRAAARSRRRASRTWSGGMPACVTRRAAAPG